MSIKKILVFFAITVAVALILLFTGSTSQAATGRNSNYSLLSAHGGGGDDAKGVFRTSTGSYARGNCAHCHEQHASIGGGEPIPNTPLGPSASLLFEDLADNVFCNYCHGASPLYGEDSISPQISKTYSHKPSGGISDVLCNKCHDSHEATTTPHSEGTNAASGILESVAGVVVAWGSPGAPGSGLEDIVSADTSAAKDPITLEYELCLSCHGGQVGGLPDISGEFDPGNFSVHPIALDGSATWKNTTLSANSVAMLKGGWTVPDTTMYCSDCHGSDNGADPIGPHGSNNVYMLKDVGSVPAGLGGPTYQTHNSGTIDALCNRCHVFNIGGASNPTAGTSAFDDQAAWNPQPVLFGDHTLPQHQYSIANNPLGCVACHGGIGNRYEGAAPPSLASNIHGANYRWPDSVAPAGTGSNSTAFLVAYPTLGPITKLYTTAAPAASWCAATCHIAGQAYRYK